MSRFRLTARLALSSLSALAAAVAIAAPKQADSPKPATAPKPVQLQKSPSAFVPGTGTYIEYASDNFEEKGWEFGHRPPKSSREQDKEERAPLGYSSNNRWHEGPERGEPDQIQVIATPAGGLAGSKKALMLRTLHSGIPGLNTYDVQQDDFIANCVNRLSGGIPVGERPSVTVRVYLPPPEQWERRSGPQFGFRTSASTMTAGKTKGFFSTSDKEVEPYWPGMWIHFRAAGMKGAKENSAYLTVRSNKMGWDFPAREIEQFGWWTFGISYSPEGMVHYYASPGVDNLTSADYLTSQFPYGYQAQQFRTYFFDVCNRNDGQTWSTPFVIDDPKLFVVNPGRVNSIVQAKEQMVIKMAERKAAAAKQMAERKAAALKEMAERKEAVAKQMAERKAAAEKQMAERAESAAKGESANRTSQRSRRTR